MDQAEWDPDGLRRGDLIVRILIDGAECWFDAIGPRDVCILAERFLRHLATRGCRPTILVEGQDTSGRSWVRDYLDGVLSEIDGCPDR